VALATLSRDYLRATVRHGREAAIIARMPLDPAELPDDVAALKALLV
jgi:hypothetical protein